MSRNVHLWTLCESEVVTFLLEKMTIDRFSKNREEEEEEENEQH